MKIHTIHHRQCSYHFIHSKFEPKVINRPVEGEDGELENDEEGGECDEEGGECDAEGGECDAEGGECDEEGGECDEEGGECDAEGGECDAEGGECDEVGGECDEVGGECDEVGGECDEVGGECGDRNCRGLRVAGDDEQRERRPVPPPFAIHPDTTQREHRRAAERRRIRTEQCADTGDGWRSEDRCSVETDGEGRTSTPVVSRAMTQPVNAMNELTIAESRKRATAAITSQKKRPVTPDTTRIPRPVEAKQRGSVVIEWCGVKCA
ncbi:hypothetical protein BLNAU_24191 [Blattamonas nauphoetae]|uniref:Uncharacterized protein n=1 Tax=Blattamonas nauphoetae TaxID=2049346 RepID=A0ABQ9WP27_9EUKA|nr:hypothetical protein BLNAU_24191 [Blattamonas nauphoetae]